MGGKCTGQHSDSPSSSQGSKEGWVWENKGRYLCTRGSQHQLAGQSSDNPSSSQGSKEAWVRENKRHYLCTMGPQHQLTVPSSSFPLPPPSQLSPLCVFCFPVLGTEISRRGAAHRTGWMVANDLASAKDPSALQYNPWSFSAALGLCVPGLWSL